MRRLLLAITCVTLLAVPASGDSKTDVLFGTGPGTKGEIPTYLADLLQDWIGQALQNARPCSRSLATKDAAALIGWERMKSLLGAGDDNALANIGGAMGASTLGTVTVLQVGDQITVTFSTLDTRTARTVSRDRVTVSTKDWDSALAALEAFAKHRGRDLASEMRSCPEPDESEKRRQRQEAAERRRLGHAEGRVDAYAAGIK